MENFLLISDGENIAVITKTNKSVSEFNTAIETAINEHFIYVRSRINRFEDNMSFDCNSIDEDDEEENREFTLQAIAIY